MSSRSNHHHRQDNNNRLFYHQPIHHSSSSTSLDSRQQHHKNIIVNRSRSVTFKDEQPPMNSNYRHRNLSLRERSTHELTNQPISFRNHHHHHYQHQHQKHQPSESESESESLNHEFTTTSSNNQSNSRYPTLIMKNSNTKRRSQSISNLAELKSILINQQSKSKPKLIISNSNHSLPTINTLPFHDDDDQQKQQLGSLSFKSIEPTTTTTTLKSNNSHQNHHYHHHQNEFNHTIQSDSSSSLEPKSKSKSKSQSKSDSNHHYNHQLTTTQTPISPTDTTTTTTTTHSKFISSSSSSSSATATTTTQTQTQTQTHSMSLQSQPQSNTSSSSNSNSNPSIISSPPSSIHYDNHLEFPIRLDTRIQLISILESILGSHRLSTLVSNLDQLRTEPIHQSPSIVHQSTELQPIQSPKPPDSSPSSTDQLQNQTTTTTTTTHQPKGLLKRLGWVRTRAITLASIFPSTPTPSTNSNQLNTQSTLAQSQSDPILNPFRLFGAPLAETACASCVTIIGGQKHRLPILIFKTVEEIYTRGLGIAGLFQTKGNPIRIESLIKSFECPPSFGDLLALDREEVFDLCDLLKGFLWSLPQPLLEPDLGELFWATCVDEDSPDQLPIPTRVTIAQVIFRLLPTRSFSLLVYLIAFLSQIPLFPGNQLTLQLISQIFGPALLAPRKLGTVGLGINPHSFPELTLPKESLHRAVNGLTWLQSHWNQITDGLLDERIRSPPSQPSCLPPVPTSPRALTIVEEASFECDSEGQPEPELEDSKTDYKKTEAQHKIEIESTIGLATSPDIPQDLPFDSRHPTKIPYALPHHSTARISVSHPPRHLNSRSSTTLEPRKPTDSSRSLSISSSSKNPLDSRPTSYAGSLIDNPQSTARMSSANLSRHLDPSLSITPEAQTQKAVDPPRSRSALLPSAMKYSDPRPISSSRSLLDYTQSKASKSLSDVCRSSEAGPSVLPESRETLVLPRSLSVSSVHKLSDIRRIFCAQPFTEAFGIKPRSPPASHFRRDSETSNASITLSSASVSSALLTPVKGTLTRPQEKFSSKVSEAETEPIFVSSSLDINTSPCTANTTFGSSLSNVQSIVDSYEAHGPDQLRKIIDSFKGQDHRERRVSTYTVRCESCTPVHSGDSKRYSLGLTSTAGGSPKPCSCSISTRSRATISTRTKRGSPTSLVRKTTQAVKQIGVTEAEEDSDPILALSEMMRSKNGMIRAQAETIKAQAELLAESERRLAVQSTAHHHQIRHPTELDIYFLPFLSSLESISEDHRPRFQEKLNRLRTEWETERNEYVDENGRLKKKLMITLQDYEKVCDQLMVIRRAIGGDEPIIGSATTSSSAI